MPEALKSKNLRQLQVRDSKNGKGKGPTKDFLSANRNISKKKSLSGSQAIEISNLGLKNQC